MTASTIRSSSYYSRVIDLIVLTASFLLLAMIIDFGHPVQVILNLFFYVAVMFVSLRLSKRMVFEYLHLSGRIIRVLLGNVVGLITGASLMVTLYQIIPGLGESVLIVIFSSVLAFFIFGTISPMVKSSHRDIIHH